MLDPSESHEMELVHTDEAGTEEWHCPTCGRRFLMRWPPAYQKTVLKAGDVYATHLGGKGGLRMGAAAVFDVDAYLAEPEPLLPAGPEPVLDEDLLGPWRRIIDQIDPE